MKKLLAIGAFLLLAACGAGQPSPAPTVSTAALQQKVLLAEVAWEGAQDVIIAYNKRPRCTEPRTVITCSDQRAMNELRKLNRAVMSGFDTAMKLASTPGVTESSVIAAMAVAQTGIPGVQAIIATYK